MQFRYELRPPALLHAVDGPEHLLQSVQVDHLPGFAPGVVRREGAVVGRVPVLTRYHDRVLWHKLIRQRYYRISFGYRQHPGRHEIHLKVDEDEGTHRRSFSRR